MSVDGRLVRSLVSGVFLVFLALFLIFSCSLFKVFSELCQSYAQQQAARSVLWCNMEGDPTTYSGPVPSIESVAQGLVFASPGMLKFRHSDHFLAGNLNSYLENWSTILQDFPSQDFVLPIISHGVVISDYFQPFQGTFLKSFTIAIFLPGKYFRTPSSTLHFKDLSSTLLWRECEMAPLLFLAGWEKLNPHTWCSLLPLNLKKNRMCHNERFLNRGD